MACHYVRILFPLELCLLETIPLSVVIFGMNTDTVIYILVKVVFSFSWSYVKFWGYIPKYFHKYYLTFKETTSLFFSIFYNRVHFNYYRIMQVETYKVFNFLLNLKAMVPDSSTLAWKISWTKEPGRLQSMGSRRVRQDWATSLSLFTFHFHALKKEMATHSSVLAWRIPGTGEPGGLLSMGSHRVGHD